ncbi:translation elongation factor Ts [methane-oxidizing endosymbiont of Gigantopelta aegis]|uniref:translation elongation factor Ts n=1 Tax=methane-oxidizing endosymbiont of Gigantopelta aegis TaxID=2794938 RepID=UPI0018DDE671|nr:translation elongation factor Ts [methane-oxidizing endosymbiont of Gigantopelta aegis]
MSITAAMVKELRERTGSGMMECKKALVETNGDMEKAIENMRKSGLAKADKKSGRTAAEGTVGIKTSDDGKTAAMVDVNCETDFVAKGDDFTRFVNDIATILLTNDVENIEQLADLKLPSGETVDEARRALIAKLGENITIRRFVKYVAEGGVGSYLHGSKIGVIVELAKADDALGKDIAMHVAAINPAHVSEKDVPQQMIDKEKEIFSAQALESGKPAEIVEKMITGRIKKFLAEITLEGQPFVKDDKTTVGNLLKSQDNTVIRFTRFEVGEGIEKKEEDFAAEVMAQVKG